MILVLPIGHEVEGTRPWKKWLRAVLKNEDNRDRSAAIPEPVPYIACVDVCYLGDRALAAAVALQGWSSASAQEEVVVPITGVSPYEPGQFFRRELPCILAALAALKRPPQRIIIDGYVWLSDENHMGLGGHLYHHLERRIPIIGVGKTRFYGATSALEITRGQSRSPLFITAAGMDVDDAARCIREMHGPYRIPTLLKRVDALCRSGTPAPTA